MSAAIENKSRPISVGFKKLETVRLRSFSMKKSEDLPIAVVVKGSETATADEKPNGPIACKMSEKFDPLVKTSEEFD